ncbi:hypothetical protein EC957_010836 [Mortierella hygrophila]|uniref:SAP domain-containing protein n=1 Tax=Mortierella hygrophila TaxID=979708 RepID=A0A9P6F9D8_9FUNG|nr:hypothetical protein EC957_010836 [Mortierella hygrophila]
MSVVSLSRRRKADLKDLAASLGLSEDGVREDIVERIRAHIATSNDPSLRALIRDDSPDTTTTTTTTTTTKENTASTSGRVSPRKKTTSTIVTKESRSSSSVGARRGSHSHSHTEDEELEERQVRGFVEHMQEELHEAKDLAEQLEETLHAKFTTGNSSHDKSTSTRTATSGGSRSYNSTSLNSGGRRGSKDHSSYSRHDSGHASSLQHHEGEDSSSHLLRSRRLHHDDEDDDEEEGGHHRHSKHHHGHHHGHHHHHDHGWGTQAIYAFKNHVVEHIRQNTSKPWKRLQDMGSTSRGFVWLTLLLEFVVFLSQAEAHFKNTSGGSGLGYLINWPNFLQPFFSYYGTFFLLPTLLSQLFNVDASRSSASSSSNKQSLTGLLSKHTTSALSYFVFKFALTYFLGHSIGFKSLFGTALPAGAKMWSGCKYISDIFRYVPQTLGLATSGAGTILALAESIVQSNRQRR